jgi:hypothetical protein
LAEGADVVRDPDFESVEILDPHVGKRGEIKLEVVAPDCQNRTVVLAETFEHSLALQIARMDDQVGVFDQVENVLRNGIRTLPMSVGKDCNSHGSGSSY